MTIAACLDKFTGVFEPKTLSNNPVVEEVYTSVRSLVYLDHSQDKYNLKRDVNNIQKDFKKATKEAINK